MSKSKHDKFSLSNRAKGPRGGAYNSYLMGFGLFLVAFVVAGIVASIFAPTSSSSAQELVVDNDSTGYYVKITAADKVEISVEATAAGATAVSSPSTINVKTNAPLGYKLYLSADNNELVNTSETASDSAKARTFMPTSRSTLSANTWGFSTTGTGSTWNAVPQVTGDDKTQGAYKLAEADAPTADAGENTTIYYGVNADTSMPGGTYATTITYTAIAQYVNFPGTMQDLTQSDCQRMNSGDTVTLKDSRNQQSYVILKALDGNCWMTDNLKLYSTDNNTIIATTSDTDIKSGTFTVPKSTNWSGNQYTSALLHVADGTGQYADKTGAYNGEVYYNWCAALAKGSCAESSGTIDQSICPKGWRLPINGDANTDKSWAKLMNAYSITTGAQLLAQANLGFYKYYGNWLWNNVSETNQGAGGYFWSSTAYSETNAYYLNYYSTGINPQYNTNKGYGFSVRCVLR